MSNNSETVPIGFDDVGLYETSVWVQDGIGDEPLPLQRNSSVVDGGRDTATKADRPLQKGEHPGWMQEETQHLPDLAPGNVVEIAGEGLCVVLLSAGAGRETALVEGEDGRPFNIAADNSRIINTI